MQRNTLKCPKCRAKCVGPINRAARNPSTICIADYTGDGQQLKLPDADLKVRIWSYMKPPRISESISSINAHRLEIVRGMLDGSAREKPSRVRVANIVNLEFLADGSIRKTTTRVDKKLYSPRPGPDVAFDLTKIICSTKTQ